jgi:hypothetical protein
MNEKLEVIRQACIKANSEICKQGWVEDKPIRKVGSLPRSRVKRGVVCRPIRLADVLLAMGKGKPTHYMVATNGLFTERKTKEVTATPFAVPFLSTGVLWNLRADDLTQQSPGCIEFLYSLLNSTT